jgi:hypothetical protein
MSNDVKKFDVFLERAYEKFGNKFKYSLIGEELKAMTEYITVTCPEHGSFPMMVKSHLKSVHGCKKCGYSANKINFIRGGFNEFIKRV